MTWGARVEEMGPEASVFCFLPSVRFGGQDVGSSNRWRVSQFGRPLALVACWLYRVHRQAGLYPAAALATYALGRPGDYSSSSSSSSPRIIAIAR